MMLKRRALLSAVVSLPLAGPVRAQEGAAAPIVALNAALLAAMRAGRATPFAAREAILRPAVEGAFDLGAILAASVGPRYAGFAPEGRAALLAAFTEFTVATWTANFDSYAGETLEVAPETRASGADTVVTSRIVPRSGEATRLDFVMRQGPAGWRAVDILVNGTISRVAVQRSDFRTLVAGGNPAPLIASLSERAAKLAGGARS
jgi:phospholipid transport system substrate-binding protein